jgi:hypothetical protein
MVSARVSGSKRKQGGDDLPTAAACGPVPDIDTSYSTAATSPAVDMVPTVQQVAALRRMCDVAQSGVAAALTDTRADVGTLQAEVRAMRAQLEALVALVAPLASLVSQDRSHDRQPERPAKFVCTQPVA